MMSAESRGIELFCILYLTLLQICNMNRRMNKKISPINGRVFVRRDADIDEKDGFAVGDGAKVKNMVGTVEYSSHPVVRPGDRVHLPYQRGLVEDLNIYGRELACLRAADLFCVIDKNNQPRPINGYILCRKCIEDHVRDEDGEIALYMTERHIEYTNWMEILGCSRDCEFDYSEFTGWFTPIKEHHEKLQRVGYTDDWCVHESLIQFITDGDV